MTFVPYAHEPYIQAVTKALDAAGLTVADWGGEDDETRTAWITLDPAVTSQHYPGYDITLTWTEERGWSFGWGEPASDRIDWIGDLHTGVLPTPTTVVSVVRVALEHQRPSVTGPWSRYRYCGDEDDFEQQLMAYHH
ncbi:DUF6292 family protein [Streptomyces albus]|uniref:DUF6292 family protein n=1 Tax=Streptomyces albus TaxID=1888 RepID=UPI000559D335|nr:DUF6292 family protein [Streptomyces albus]